MTAVTINNQYNNTLTKEGVFKIIKFTTGTYLGTSPAQTIPLGNVANNNTWIGLGAFSAGGTAITYTISGVTATISSTTASGVTASEVCAIMLSQY